MLKRFRADLHIHSCLSPCGGEEMKPQAVVDRAMTVGLDMIAICDHNSAENLAAFIEAGKKEGLAVLPGMEVASREEGIPLLISLLPSFELAGRLYQAGVTGIVSC